jgi:hypothetical protein
VKSAPDCSPKPASQVFARWRDSSQYNLAPGGSFEAGAAAWSLGQWKPGPKLLVVANLLPLLPGEHTPVRFRVTSIGTGTWSVDDFYVDPRCR